MVKVRLAVVFAAFVLAGPVGAQPPGAPAYRTNYYNNASHDTLIGSIFPFGCTYDELMGDSVNYRRTGSTSPYSTNELVGYCLEGNYNPV